MQAADSVVRAFLATLAQLRRDLPAGIPGAHSINDVTRMAVQREIPRNGVLPNGIEYSVHGVGCRITTADGLEVNVDLTEDGVEIFEVWRLWNFANTLPNPTEVTREELTAAAGRLVETGELREIRSGWYAAAR